MHPSHSKIIVHILLVLEGASNAGPKFVHEIIVVTDGTETTGCRIAAHQAERRTSLKNETRHS